MEVDMWRRKAFFVIVGLTPAMVYCQGTPEVSFAVASVKRVDLSRAVFEETPSGIRYRCALASLVLRAYELKPYELGVSRALGDPAEEYEVLAKLPEGARQSDIPAML